jgi:hypothetical protein
MTEPAIAQQPAEPPAASPAAASATPAPRAGGITDGAYDGLSPDQQDRYARVRKGPTAAASGLRGISLVPNPPRRRRPATSTNSARWNSPNRNCGTF